MENPKSTWEDDSIQFPRLIAEILATQELDLQGLVDSMDLEMHELDELFTRAQTEWERVKNLYLFLNHYDRLTEIDDRDWSPDNEEEWFSLTNDAAHLLAGLLREDDN